MSSEVYVCENLCLQVDPPRKPVADQQPGLNRAQRRRWIFGHAKDCIGKRRGER